MLKILDRKAFVFIVDAVAAEAVVSRQRLPDNIEIHQHQQQQQQPCCAAH